MKNARRPGKESDGREAELAVCCTPVPRELGKGRIRMIVEVPVQAGLVHAVDADYQNVLMLGPSATDGVPDAEHAPRRRHRLAAGCPRRGCALFQADVRRCATAQLRLRRRHRVHRLIGEASQMGSAVTLGVAKSNPALRPYERLGFTTTHEDERKVLRVAVARVRKIPTPRPG